MMVQAQFITMVAMIISGVYLGMALETFRRMSTWWRHYIILVYVFEVLFWVSQTVVLFVILYQLNYGELRLYIFLACLLGFSIYVVLLKKIYRYILEVVISTIALIIKWIVIILSALIVQPVIWLLTFIIRLLHYILYVSYRLILAALKLIFIPLLLLKPVVNLLLPNIFIEKSSQLIAKCSTMLNKSILKLRYWIVRKGGK